jgi:hypothetical protein
MEIAMTKGGKKSATFAYILDDKRDMEKLVYVCMYVRTMEAERKFFLFVIESVCSYKSFQGIKLCGHHKTQE